MLAPQYTTGTNWYSSCTKPCGPTASSTYGLGASGSGRKLGTYLLVFQLVLSVLHFSQGGHKEPRLEKPMTNSSVAHPFGLCEKLA